MTAPRKKPGPPKGTRIGGRQKGTPNKATAEIKAAAQEYGPKALKRLAHLMMNAESEQAQVSACREILDRGYGKPAQHNTNDNTHDVSDPMAELLKELSSRPVFPKEHDRN